LKIGDYLTPDEVAYFTHANDWHGWRLVIANWAAIAAIVALPGYYPNPVTIVLAITLLGGRQLALSVLMHDCGHRSLFRSRKLNQTIGQWLCALPVLNDQPSYARGHRQHHRKAGTPEDPDLPNYRDYPVNKASFRRKVMRDLGGQTGIKVLAYLARGTAGAMSNEAQSSSTLRYQQIGVQLALFGTLYAFGIGWTYLLWVIAYLTVYMLYIRIRQIAEHAAVPDRFDPDPRNNTRTVLAPRWQRLLLAPNGVNYHIEHHFIASVPCYRLRELHELLRQRGAFEQLEFFNGYGAVLRHAVRA
jgi:fatty acid desaturase